MRWTVYIGMDCGCAKGPFHNISTEDKDIWKGKHGEPIYCDKHDLYSRVQWVRAGAA